VIGAYTTDQATWIKPVKNQWGEQQPPTETEVRCRITRANRLVRDATGTEVTSSSQLLIETKPEPDDKFRFDDRDHVVIAIQEKKSFARSHWEVFLA